MFFAYLYLLVTLLSNNEVYAITTNKNLYTLLFYFGVLSISLVILYRIETSFTLMIIEAEFIMFLVFSYIFSFNYYNFLTRSKLIMLRIVNYICLFFNFAY